MLCSCWSILAKCRPNYSCQNPTWISATNCSDCWCARGTNLCPGLPKKQYCQALLLEVFDGGGPWLDLALPSMAVSRIWTFKSCWFGWVRKFDPFLKEFPYIYIYLKIHINVNGYNTILTKQIYAFRHSLNQGMPWDQTSTGQVLSILPPLLPLTSVLAAASTISFGMQRHLCFWSWSTNSNCETVRWTCQNAGDWGSRRIMEPLSYKGVNVCSEWR